MSDGYQSPSVAKMETKRGTADATYLYYTLGKLEILKLRDDVKKKQGAAFTWAGSMTHSCDRVPCRFG